MAYFNELPNIDYISPFSDRTSNSDYITSKNIFSRAKVRNGILKNLTGFKPYYIKDGERPDTIAEKIYGDSELDWVILTTNNITNLNEQWPLENNTLYKYLLDKYGSEENLRGIHHYETVEVKDQYNRLVLSGGLEVDYGFARSFTTQEGKGIYTIPSFQSSNLSIEVKINLNQFLEIPRRDYDITIKVTDTQIKESKLYAQGRNQIYSINITNSLLPWPSGWGGTLNVTTRSGNLNVSLDDEIGSTYINLPRYLYDFIRKEENGTIITEFVFVPQS